MKKNFNSKNLHFLKGRKGKKGSIVDIFLFLVFTFVLLLVGGIYIYISTTTSTQLHKQLDGQSTAEVNYTKTINETYDKVPQALQILYWASILIIFAMIISIFVGSYLVTTKPIYFIAFIFVVIIAIIVSVPMSNSYIGLIGTPELAPTYAGYIGANHIMLYLPLWTTIIGFIGAIILFIRMRQSEVTGYG
jgi:hypothetical protein